MILPSRMLLAALGARHFPFPSLLREDAVSTRGTRVFILIGGQSGNGIESGRAHLPHFFHEFPRVTRWLASDPEPIVNHLMRHRIADVAHRILLFQEISRDFDERRKGGIALQRATESSRCGLEPSVPLQKGGV